MLRKISGRTETIGVVEEICVTFKDIVPPVPPTTIYRPALPQPPVIEMPVNENNSQPLDPDPAPPPDPRSFKYIQIQYFDDFQQRVVTKWVVCAPGYWGSQATDVPALTDITILTPGGCG